MSTPSLWYLMSPVAAFALALISPESLIAQTPSARPASVSLTAVVPSTLRLGDTRTANGTTAVLRRDGEMLDLETVVGLADRPASRIEVRLGAGWPSDSGSVLVRNRRGDFEALASDANVVVIDAPASLSRSQAALRFRVAPNRAVFDALAIPVEYRITVGTSDQIAIWSFPTLLRVDAAR